MSQNIWVSPSSFPVRKKQKIPIMPARPVYIRPQADFTANNISLKQVTQFKRCLFSENIIIFHHLELEIALAIPASNDEKYY